MVLPGSTMVLMAAASVCVFASGITLIRILPNPAFPLSSTATRMSTFPAAPRPLFPGFTPPRNTSSTSTVPERRSRPTRVMAPRMRARRYQPVICRLMPSACASPSALTPLFCDTTSHNAWNQRRNGMRLSPKVVPAVTDVSRRHPAHRYVPRAFFHARPCPHEGHRNPPSQRMRER